jgi:cardiolipin synthase
VVTHYLASHLLTVITAIVSTVMVIRLLSTNRTPQSLLAWVLALIFLPLAAIPLYFLIGTRKFPRAAKRTMRPQPSSEVALESGPVARVLSATGVPAPQGGHDFELLETGEHAYARLMERIAAARRSIALTMFIVGDDATGWSVVDALAARARDGVRVRVIVDAVGSRRIKRRAARALEAAGASLRVFMPLLHAPLRGRTNLRCHRKLAVFDDAHVFVGGMNIAEEYMGAAAREERWRDVAAIASGRVALDASMLFESDWAFCGGSEESVGAVANGSPRRPGDATVQIVPSGPDMVHDTMYDAVLTAIFVAVARVSVVTPYYVPDDGLQRALILAARRGVCTELIMPARSNHPMTDFARRGLLRGLAAAGVRLRFYPRGMLHAKAMVVDRRVRIHRLAEHGHAELFPQLRGRALHLLGEARRARPKMGGRALGRVHARPAAFAPRVLAPRADRPDPRAGVVITRSRRRRTGRGTLGVRLYLIASMAT